MKKILLFVLLVSALFFSFQRLSETQIKPDKVMSEQDKNKPNLIALKPGEPHELRGRTEPANAGNDRHERPDRAGEGQPVTTGHGSKGNAGREHRILQLAPRGDAEPPFVDEGARSDPAGRVRSHGLP